ncbi:hypothetical protein CC80DRAFT_162772 [Byssothecium circinans]|uniref:Uncharacterized protein n=1 Tax=Byssothecium circinans TaxID=147558 RepID=A0A6A5UCZ1_9PLEO|nr:hypothetical protein CC80DRAFT_162772 [Byssothecium circinans]
MPVSTGSGSPIVTPTGSNSANNQSAQIATAMGDLGGVATENNINVPQPHLENSEPANSSNAGPSRPQDSPKTPKKGTSSSKKAYINSIYSPFPSDADSAEIRWYNWKIPKPAPSDCEEQMAFSEQNAKSDFLTLVEAITRLGLDPSKAHDYAVIDIKYDMLVQELPQFKHEYVKARDTISTYRHGLGKYKPSIKAINADQVMESVRLNKPNPFAGACCGGDCDDSVDDGAPEAPRTSGPQWADVGPHPNKKSKLEQPRPMYTYRKHSVLETTAPVDGINNGRIFGAGFPVQPGPSRFQTPPNQIIKDLLALGSPFGTPPKGQDKKKIGHQEEVISWMSDSPILDPSSAFDTSELKVSFTMTLKRGSESVKTYITPEAVDGEVRKVIDVTDNILNVFKTEGLDVPLLDVVELAKKAIAHQSA